MLQLVWGIKLKKVDLSWPAVFSKSYNPSWIELNFLSSPWIELTQILHICPRLDLTQVEPTNSSQLRVDPKLKKINFFQVNSRKSWKNLKFFKINFDELILNIPKYLIPDNIFVQIKWFEIYFTKAEKNGKFIWFKFFQLFLELTWFF